MYILDIMLIVYRIISLVALKLHSLNTVVVIILSPVDTSWLAFRRLVIG